MARVHELRDGMEAPRSPKHPVKWRASIHKVSEGLKSYFLGVDRQWKEDGVQMKMNTTE